MTTRTLLLAAAAIGLFAVSYHQISRAKAATPDGTTDALALAGPPASPSTSADAAASITWMTWDEAMAAQKTNPKKLVVDVYTDWCGWCKRMDATTFKDPKVSAYVAEHYHAVKFDAERKDDITYDGHTFSFQRQGKRGVHALAASLLDNRLSYPSVVYFNDAMERIMISPGYKDADNFLKELKYANGEGE